MENVDFSIELVRIREFDGSGGSIELFKTHFFLRSQIRLIILFSQSGACKAISLHWFHSVIQSQELEN